MVTGHHHKGEKPPPARICEREGVVAAIWRRDVVIEPVLASGNNMNEKKEKEKKKHTKDGARENKCSPLRWPQPEEYYNILL